MGEARQVRQALVDLPGCHAPAVRRHESIRRAAMHDVVRVIRPLMGEAIWSNDTWVSQGELMSWILDPVITVHPDRIFFEAFSQDQSAYAMVIAKPEMFATDGDIVTGTTNVDFSAWLWGALNELRSSRETWLRVGAQGFEVKTKGAGGRFEQKVDLPDNWVRGFLQVSSAMAMPGTRITVKPADLQPG